MADNFQPEFIGAVPWHGPGLSKEIVDARTKVCTAHHLARFVIQSWLVVVLQLD